ncbi:MAG: hypothetical protein NVS3B12_19560 [Acidimicrobiales bacterium]
MGSGMYDTKLVRAAQEGDEAAFAAIYDRSADAVYDFCWSLIGDVEEAARIVEETMILAARHLGELSDPSQVRAWLLAIARDRILSEDDQGTLRAGWGVHPPVAADGSPHVSPEEPLGTVALRKWTADASAVLALTDQAVLELQLRHELDPGQLAAAIGCSPQQLDGVTARVDQEAEHVLGALVVARQARRDCPELSEVLNGWDGTPTAEIADVVDTHATTCDRCGRRRALADPLELVKAAAVVPAPGALRNRVIDAVAPELGSHRTSVIPASVAGMALAGAVVAGGASAAGATALLPTTQSAKHRSIAPLIAIAAAAIVIAGGLILILRSPSRQQAAASVRPGTGIIAASPTTADLTPVTSAPAALPPIDTTSTTATTVVQVGRLELNAARVDFGSDATSAQVTLRDSGLGGVDWTASTTAGALAVTPFTGHLEAAGSLSVSLTLDRRLLPRGPFDIRLTFQPSDPAAPSAFLDAVGYSAGPATTTAAPTTSTSSTTSTTAGSTTTTTPGSTTSTTRVLR